MSRTLPYFLEYLDPIEAVFVEEMARFIGGTREPSPPLLLVAAKYTGQYVEWYRSTKDCANIDLSTIFHMEKNNADLMGRELWTAVQTFAGKIFNDASGSGSMPVPPSVQEDGKEEDEATDPKSPISLDEFINEHHREGHLFRKQWLERHFCLGFFEAGGEPVSWSQAFPLEMSPGDWDEMMRFNCFEE